MFSALHARGVFITIGRFSGMLPNPTGFDARGVSGERAGETTRPRNLSCYEPVFSFCRAHKHAPQVPNRAGENADKEIPLIPAPGQAGVSLGVQGWISDGLSSTRMGIQTGLLFDL